MSRIERKKKEQGEEKARAEFDWEVPKEPEQAEDELPSRQSYREKKKNSKNKNRNPLFTSLAVMFFFIPIIVFLVFMYMLNQNDADTNPGQYDDVFYEKSDETGMLDEKKDGEQSVEEEKDSQHTAAALEEEKPKEDSSKSEKKADESRQKTEKKQTEKKKEPEEKETNRAEEKPAVTKKKVAETTPPVQKAAEPKPKKVLKHTVAEKETLFRISLKYYKDRSGEEKIRNYNQLSGNNVYAGQVLDIPIY